MTGVESILFIYLRTVRRQGLTCQVPSMHSSRALDAPKTRNRFGRFLSAGRRNRDKTSFRSSDNVPDLLLQTLRFPEHQPEGNFHGGNRFPINRRNPV